MQKPFTTQPALFVSITDLEHPILHALDDTEALLDGAEIERVPASIYAAKTSRPSYPFTHTVSSCGWLRIAWQVISFLSGSGGRGSLPVPGPKTSLFGGTTSYVEIRRGERILVFDAGSGIHPLVGYRDI